MEQNNDEMILIDKPAGMTSFGVVARIRRILSEKAGKKVKVGHTGTLDPFATGLLILMVGKGTKRCAEFLKHDKCYEATACLGKVSTTGDPEGEIQDYVSSGEKTFAREPGEDSQNPSDLPDFYNTSSVVKMKTAQICPRSRIDVFEPTIESCNLVLKSFIGKITQQVPRFSAIKINGQRAYDLARKGKTPEMPTREVEIYDIKLLDYHYPYLKFSCHVSSGTYIRTLAEDIGKKLGTGAYLTELRRTKIADYDVKDAKTLEDFGIK